MTRPEVSLVEVGPRDGLQNEKTPIPTGAKVRFIEALAAAGHRRIEAAAFVSPKAVPQLADATAVMMGLSRADGVVYSALVPNEKGYEAARAADVEEIAVFTAASDTFNLRNTHATVDASFERFAPVLVQAARDGIRVRGYVSTAVVCPFEGPISPERAADVAERLLDLGCFEVSLGDTIGKAVPPDVVRLLDACRARGMIDRVAGHFHDTWGFGVANVMAAFEAGVRVFDASAGGLGGCPYAPGAGGNVATEDLVALFDALGVRTGVDLGAVVSAAEALETHIGRSVGGRAAAAWKAACRRDGG